MPLLTPGISGFGATLETSPADFKRAVYAAARDAGATVNDFVIQDGVTPSFHQSTVTFDSETLIVLCSRFCYLVAFTDRIEGALVESFAAAPHRFAAAMTALGFTVPDVAELNRELTENDVEALSPEERKQVRYWKPKRVGDIVFNWWD